MGFLKKFFGRSDSPASRGVDPDGFFLFVQCDNCHKKVRLRVNKKYDLNRSGDGYVWHKTIVDSRCFRPMPAVVTFDAGFQISNAEIEGGKLITRAEYETEQVSPPTDTKQVDG